MGHCVPHMRGDEPVQMLSEVDQRRVFPTCVGMNRENEITPNRNMSVPHMRGDEPDRYSALTVSLVCSPHAWG